MSGYGRTRHAGCLLNQWLCYGSHDHACVFAFVCVLAVTVCADVLGYAVYVCVCV